MMALQIRITRTDTRGNIWGANQRIRTDEAIRVGTINGAHASYEEKIKGSITARKLADLVVLGRDPLKENPSTLFLFPSNAPWLAAIGPSSRKTTRVVRLTIGGT